MLKDKLRYIIIFVWFLALESWAVAPVQLVALRINPSLTTSRFVFIFSKKTDIRAKYFPNPHRLIVDISNADKHFLIQNVRLNNANVISINEEPTTNHNLRFIFFTKDEIKWKFKTLPKKSGNILIQLDIISVPEKVSKPIKPVNLQESFKEDILNTFAQLAQESKKEKLSADGMVTWVPFNEEKVINTKKTAHDFTIVIDAGHGGRDTGALGENGNEEKQVVLAIAKQLEKKKLQQDKISE